MSKIRFERGFCMRFFYNHTRIGKENRDFQKKFDVKKNNCNVLKKFYCI